MVFKNSNRIKFNSKSYTLGYRQVRHYSSNSCFNNIGSYLAGLIEGDGHIAVHDKNSKSKVYLQERSALLLFLIFMIDL